MRQRPPRNGAGPGRRAATAGRRVDRPGFTPGRRFARRGFTVGWRFAQQGFTLGRRSARQGFTLVELMVVVTIIGLAAAVAVWNMPDPRGRVADEAARFALRARAAHDAAIVEARPVSIWVTAGGYGFDRRATGQWVAMAEKPLRVERWSEGTRAATGEAEGRLRIVFDPTGLADRNAQVTLTRGGARAVIDMAADGTVRVAS